MVLVTRCINSDQYAKATKNNQIYEHLLASVQVFVHLCAHLFRL